MIYVAMFDGDISELSPICGVTLFDVLMKIQNHYGYGKKRNEFPASHPVHKWGYDPDDDSIITPDPEDDKIEVWECDPASGTMKVVWGFWGWHWTMPEGLEPGKMPGHERSLYEECEF